MWDEEINLLRRVAGGDQGLLDDAGDLLHRVPEHLPPVHAQVARGLGGAWTAIYVEQLLVASIRAQACGKNAPVVAASHLRLGLEDEGPGAVPEQHARAPVLPIENAREGLGADDQRTAGLAAPDEVVCRCNGVDEARADGLDVEGGALGHAKAGLNSHGCGWKRAVRRGRGAD